MLEIGAGDLRLARRLARKARQVIAIEFQPHLAIGPALPENVTVIQADAREWPFPPDAEVGVLLMRHCRHFALYREKLSAAGCGWLVTNARWGFGVESIDLRGRRLSYEAVRLGWYACACGATGFIPGPAVGLTERLLETVHEVDTCPECRHGRNRYRLP